MEDIVFCICITVLWACIVMVGVSSILCIIFIAEDILRYIKKHSLESNG